MPIGKNVPCSEQTEQGTQCVMSGIQGIDLLPQKSLCPINKGYTLGTGAGLIRSELCSSHALGNAILARPLHCIVVVLTLLHIRKGHLVVLGCGLARRPIQEGDNLGAGAALVRGIGGGRGGRSLDLATYMRERPYMYSSENVQARFRVTHAMVSDVMDLFGSQVRFLDEDESGVTVSAYTNERALEQFAKNFAPDVVILSPDSLRNQVKEYLRQALAAYEKE